MANLYKLTDLSAQPEEFLDPILKITKTLYVGNLSFFTTEEQIFELFSKCGEIKRIVMGLDKFKKTPCGFCFVEFKTREGAASCQHLINGTRLDDRIVRTDWDVGFSEGRQFGRGKTGGQIRDEYRSDYDAGRGGFGKQAAVTPTPLSLSSPSSKRSGEDTLEGESPKRRKEE